MATRPSGKGRQSVFRTSASQDTSFGAVPVALVPKASSVQEKRVATCKSGKRRKKKRGKKIIEMVITFATNIIAR